MYVYFSISVCLSIHQKARCDSPRWWWYWIEVPMVLGIRDVYGYVCSFTYSFIYVCVWTVWIHIYIYKHLQFMVCSYRAFLFASEFSLKLLQPLYSYPVFFNMVLWGSTDLYLVLSSFPYIKSRSTQIYILSFLSISDLPLFFISLIIHFGVPEMGVSAIWVGCSHRQTIQLLGYLREIAKKMSPGPGDADREQDPRNCWLLSLGLFVLGLQGWNNMGYSLVN